MHWVKVAGEIWLFSGAVILIVGVLWTNQVGKRAMRDASRSQSSSHRRATVEAVNLSNVPSA